MHCSEWNVPCWPVNPWQTTLVSRLTQAALGQQFAALRDIRALEPRDDGDLHPYLPDRSDDALSDEIAADDATEDVHENRPDALVGQDQLERLRHPLRRRATPDIEEVGRFAAMELDQIHRSHRQARAVDHAGDVAVEGHIVETMLTSLVLLFVLLAGVAPIEQALLTEQGVGLNVDLGVQGHQTPFTGHDEWIDLHQAGVVLHEEPEQAVDDAVKLLQLLLAKTQPEGEPARLVGL
jgi:hypothetical protein